MSFARTIASTALAISLSTAAVPVSAQSAEQVGLKSVELRTPQLFFYCRDQVALNTIMAAESTREAAVVASEFMSIPISPGIGTCRYLSTPDLVGLERVSTFVYDNDLALKEHPVQEGRVLRFLYVSFTDPEEFTGYAVLATRVTSEGESGWLEPIYHYLLENNQGQ